MQLLNPFSVFVHSVASSTAAPYQAADTESDGETQAEVPQQPATSRQTDHIPESGRLALVVSVQ